MMDAFHWLRPWWLLALLVLIPWVWLRLRSHPGMSDWHRVCDPHLLPHLLQRSDANPVKRISYRLILVATLGILALAGPVWQRLPQPVFQKQTALVLILDLSLSMDASDIKPSRLDRARLKIADLLKRRREGTTALTTFAGEAFVVTPLTSDSETISAHLQALSTDIMPALGSRPDLGIDMADKLLQQAGISNGTALLITDGEVTATTQERARQFHKQGRRLHVLGVGTPEGAPIPIKQGGFLKDAQGGIVIPRLEEAPLQQLAQAGGGIYARMQVNDQDLDLLLAQDTIQELQNTTKETNLTADIWHEEGPWLLLLALPLAAMGFRRGVLVFLVSVISIKPAAALDWDSLWKRRDQQAAERLAAGDPIGAATRFTDPAWKATAQYRAGQFEESLQTLDALDSADAWYNKGNALARLNRMEESVQAYAEALKRNPEHADARYNQELVKKQLKPPPPSQSKPDDKKSQDKEQEDKKQPSNDPEKGQDQEKKEQPKEEQAKEGQAKEEQAKEEQAKEQQAKEEQAKEEQAKKDQPQEKQTIQKEQLDDEKKESQLAEEQWLRRIPDDPGGLLRRKFLYQYQRQGQTRQETNPW
ncbi:MAG: VWA domain-containing protein [Magnetococcus sp. YQC-5]